MTRLFRKKLQRSQSTDGSDSEESLTLKEIRKIRKLNKVPRKPRGEDETPKKKEENILKRSKHDLLEKCMKMHLIEDGQVPCPADNEVLDRSTQRKLDTFIENSFKEWNWHTKEEHMNWVRSQNKLIEEASSETTKKKNQVVNSACSEGTTSCCKVLYKSIQVLQHGKYKRIDIQCFVEQIFCKGAGIPRTE
jgi:hypothetical protein